MSSLSRLLPAAVAFMTPFWANGVLADGPAQPVNLSALSSADGPGWLGSMAGEKLIAVDGSTLTLLASEGGLALMRSAPNGTAQRFSLAFVSDRLGTVSDDADAGHVTGFFRETDNGLEAQFADGHTESLVANTAGGISLTVHAAAGGAMCTSWYPADHTFTAAERQAAVEAYAEHLGLHGKKTAHAAPFCVPAIKVVKNKISPRAAQSMIVVSHPVMTTSPSGTEISSKASTLPPLTPVLVRASDVHLIDGPLAAGPGLAPLPIAAVQASVAAPQPQTAPQAASPAPLQTASAQAMPAGQGASDCLSVESDGANIGFRNRCNFGIQFAYCLQRAKDPAATCDAGTKTGAISANAFAAVLLDTNIKAADTDHDFRWVACSGNTGDVVAHLDRSDPPVGRCVRTSAL